MVATSAVILFAIKHGPAAFAAGVATSFAEYKFKYSLYGSVEALVVKLYNAIFKKKVVVAPVPPPPAQ